MIIRIFFCFLLILSHQLDAQTITTRTVDSGSGATTGENISHSLIGGYPAMSYSETRVTPFSTNGRTKSIVFARNSATDGSGTWTINTVHTGTYQPDSLKSSLIEIGGKPAVFYFSSQGLWMARNSAADGSGPWFQTRISDYVHEGPIAAGIVAGYPAVVFRNGNIVKIARSSTIDGIGTWAISDIDTAENIIHGSISLATIEDKPVITYRADIGQIFMGDYYDYTYTQLRFARCATSDGSGSWSVTQVYQAPYIDEDNYFWNSLAVIDGKPSIAFYYSGDLYYARSSSNDGTATWTTTAIETVGTTGRYPTLMSIAGYPTISYYKSTGADLRITRCDAVDGNGTWTPSTVKSSNSVGAYARMIVAEGNPAIAYFDASNSGVRWTRNATADATGAWTDGGVDDGSDSGVVGTNAELVVIDGHPAISYYDELGATLGRSKYARAIDPTGLTGAWTISAPSGLSSIYASVDALGNRPAFSYTSGGAKILQNSNADGTGTWTSTTIEATTQSSNENRITMVAGYPMTLFPVPPLQTLSLARNSASDGSGIWSKTTLTGMQVTSTPILGEVAGHPAIAYMDQSSNLVYRRCSNSDGTGTWSQSVFTFYGVPQNVLNLNGLPALIFQRFLPNSQPHTIVAVNSEADGSGTWTETDLFVGYGEFAYVANHPAFAIIDPNTKTLLLRRSTTTSFDGPWETWLIDSTTECAGPSLTTLSAQTSGIAYYDVLSSSLKYAHLDFSTSTLSSLHIEIDGAILTPAQSVVHFSETKIHSPALARTVTLRNTGSSDITISSVLLSGVDAALFTHNAAALTLAAGASTTITLGYEPSNVNSAVHSAALAFATSDPMLPSVTLELQGRPLALDTLESWRFEHFGTPLNEGDAADDANPDNDRSNNFFEFCTGTDPQAANLYTPTLEIKNGNMEFTYTRSKEAVAYGVIFNVPWTETLIETEEIWDWHYEDTVQSVISETATMETVKAVVPMGTAGRRFLCLEPW